MTITSIFMNNRTQAVRLPATFRFSSEIKNVYVRKIGVERVISPVDQVWDSFFTDKNLKVTDDFERGEQIESIRESF